MPQKPPVNPNMILYTGEGDYTCINLRLFGNGVTTDVTINLSKAPFNLQFKGVYPKAIAVVNVSPALPKNVSLAGDDLIVVFENPPPAVVLEDIITGPPENHLEFKVYFAYGTGI